MPDMSLINGIDIINFYIQNKSDKIFDWEPKLSKEKLYELVMKNRKDDENNDAHSEIEKEKILRVITKNDVRARILRIPNEIFEKISEENSYNVIIDGCEKQLNMIKEIKSFAGITEFYRKHNYIDNEQANRNSYWSIDVKNKKIYVELGDQRKRKKQNIEMKGLMQNFLNFKLNMMTYISKSIEKIAEQPSRSSIFQSLH